MKIGTVTKLGSKTKQCSEKIDGDVMSTNCDVIDIFPIYGQFEAIWKLDSGRTVCKTLFYIVCLNYSFICC